MRKYITIFALLIININYTFGQENKTGLTTDKLFNWSEFSNLINSKAPHKINIFNSDKYPATIDNSNISNSTEYYDYNTSLIKAIRVGLSFGLGIEFYKK